MKASLDLQDPEDDRTGNLLPRRARQHGALSVLQQVGPVQLGVEFVASSLRYDDAENLRKMGGYGIVNLTLDWPFAKGWSLFVRGNNVFDKNYELARGLLDRRRAGVRGRALAAMIGAMVAVRSRCLRFAAVATRARAVRVVDDAGARSRSPRPAQRIVSLAPHATELLFAAGAGSALVGVVAHSDWPPAARALPRVGDARALDLERIVALAARSRRHLAVHGAGAGRGAARARHARVHDAIRATIDGIADDIEKLGTLAGTRGVAPAAAARVARAARDVDGAPRAARARCASSTRSGTSRCTRSAASISSREAIARVRRRERVRGADVARAVGERRGGDRRRARRDRRRRRCRQAPAVARRLAALARHAGGARRQPVRRSTAICCIGRARASSTAWRRFAPTSSVARKR